MLIDLPIYGGEFRRYNSALDRVEYAMSRKDKRVVLAGKGSRAYEREQSCLVQDSDWFPCPYQDREELEEGRARAAARMDFLKEKGKRALLKSRAAAVSFDNEKDTLHVGSMSFTKDSMPDSCFVAGILTETVRMQVHVAAWSWGLHLKAEQEGDVVRIYCSVPCYDEEECE